MSLSHILDLRKRLEASGWTLATEGAGDGRAVSAIWVIVDRSGKRTYRIVFEGMDEREVLPIERAYACHVHEAPRLSLYFAGFHGPWKDAARTFVDALDRVQGQ